MGPELWVPEARITWILGSGSSEMSYGVAADFPQLHGQVAKVGQILLGGATQERADLLRADNFQEPSSK